MKIFITHSNNFDYKQNLYKPLRSSELNNRHDIILPHEDGKKIETKNIIMDQDLVIAEISYPSTGSGIEMGWANAFDVPILGVFKARLVPSNAASYITKKQIEYENSEDLILKLTDYLNKF